ncbi:MAG: IS110 family transposase, partial [Firmicutes bacterium]|nr:IS110 family transposase [Bacillota bacterium]
MDHITKFVSLDVSKETIAVAVAERGTAPPRYLGSVANTPEAVRKLVRRLGKPEQLLACYEAGPTGYGLYRLLSRLGVRCLVVAPSLTPVRPGDQVKTDRRDALRLAQLLRAGELTPVWVPGEEEEALRDLVRAREGAKRGLKRARQELSSFLLRHGIAAPKGTKRWSRMFLRLLDTLSFPHRATQVAYQEYVEAVRAQQARVDRLEAEIHALATESRQAPVIQALQALKGVGEVTAVTLAAEIGEFSR